MGCHTSQGRWISDIKRGESRASHCQDLTHLHSSKQPNQQLVFPTVFISLPTTNKNPRAISEDGDLSNIGDRRGQARARSQPTGLGSGGRSNTSRTNRGSKRRKEASIVRRRRYRSKLSSGLNTITQSKACMRILLDQVRRAMVMATTTQGTQMWIHLVLCTIWMPHMGVGMNK